MSHAAAINSPAPQLDHLLTPQGTLWEVNHPQPHHFFALGDYVVLYSSPETCERLDFFLKKNGVAVSKCCSQSTQNQFHNLWFVLFHICHKCVGYHTGKILQPGWALPFLISMVNCPHWYCPPNFLSLFSTDQSFPFS